jgi:ABC-2 type transport system ATP-binding protein
MPALAVKGLTKSYKRNVALAGVDLELGEGELVGLLGPNGAGKSTLVKIACGLVTATSGSVEVVGSPAGSKEARAAIGYLPELFRFQPWLKADEVLSLHQDLSRSEGGDAERARLLELVGLEAASARRVGEMSKGMQQRLGLAQALVGSPKLLLLDEPTSALDPAGRRVVRAILEELKGAGVSVLLNSHLLSEIELVCDRVVILVAGEIVTSGEPRALVEARGVEVETSSGTRTYPEKRRDDVPALVARLVRAGESVYSVRYVRSTLEDVYMSAVEGEKRS